MYMNRPLYVEFLVFALSAKPDNILLKNLWYILTSLEMVAMCRVYAIFHIGICLPHRWLAGKTHQLAEFGWGPTNMSQVLDVIYTKLEQIENNPKLFLDMEFMATIYKEFENRIDPFKDYLIYMLSCKKNCY